MASVVKQQMWIQSRVIYNQREKSVKGTCKISMKGLWSDLLIHGERKGPKYGMALRSNEGAVWRSAVLVRDMIQGVKFGAAGQCGVGSGTLYGVQSLELQGKMM